MFSARKGRACTNSLHARPTSFPIREKIMGCRPWHTLNPSTLQSIILDREGVSTFSLTQTGFAVVECKSFDVILLSTNATSDHATKR